MRLITVEVENFRCLETASVELDDLTMLVGANGSGKSTLLRALDWFFEGYELGVDDVYRHQEEVEVRVTCTFGEFTAADRDALERYAIGDTTVISRSFSVAEGEKSKLTGQAYTFPPFDEVRANQGALPQRNAFNAFVNAHPELGLATVANRDQLDDAMTRFEQDNRALLEPTEADASHLFGFVGGARLKGRFSFVFVPAVSDASDELVGARGTLLTRLLERLPEDAGEMTTALDELKENAQREADKLIRERHAESLKALGHRMTEALQEFVATAEVMIDVQPPAVRVTDPSFDVRVADDGLPTDIAHQGHGFQRALIMAALNELARFDEDGDVPAVFLAIEEPELYQHPLQARHFSKVLAALPHRGEAGFQVAYATHSQFFVTPERYERLRRFSRSRADGARKVTVAHIGRVADRLAGIVPADQIESRIKMTLERQIAEAVFADVAVLVEGKTDAGLLAGIADRDGGFEAEGIALVNVEGKHKLPIAAAVLGELGIPVYVVFDADSRKAERSRISIGADDVHRDERLEKIQHDEENTAAWNRKLLGSVGAQEEDWPSSGVYAKYAVFVDRIEDEWPEAMAEAARLAEAAGDSPKREEWYREAAKTLAGDRPALLLELVEAVRALR
jgi:putative ATP-dependent endonuclease of the OLD family